MTFIEKNIRHTEVRCVGCKFESRNHYHCQMWYRKYIVTKIPKAGNSKTTKWGRYIYVVTYCLEKIVDTPSAAFYFQFRDPPLISNKVPDLEFYWRTDHEFYISLGISNCKSVWSTDKFVRKMMLLCKK